MEFGQNTMLNAAPPSGSVDHHGNARLLDGTCYCDYAGNPKYYSPQTCCYGGHLNGGKSQWPVGYGGGDRGREEKFNPGPPPLPVSSEQFLCTPSTMIGDGSVMEREKTGKRENASKDKSLSALMKSLLMQSTAHGIPRAARGPHWLRTVFWITVFITCFASFIIQTFHLSLRFFDFPVNTKLSVVPRKEVTWPSVTVCNLNKLVRKNVDDEYDYMNAMVLEAFVHIQKAEHGCENDTYLLDCGDGECGPAFWACDGYYDCTNHHDEVNDFCCDTLMGSVYYQDVTEVVWECATPFVGTNKTQCIHTNNRCNGLVDCHDGSDEQGCNGTFKDSSDQENSPWLKVYRTTKKKDYSDIQDMGTTPMEAIRKHGEQIEDFILQCSFDGETCNHSNFVTWQNDVYGNCFTFNHRSQEKVQTVREGSMYGLKLALFIGLEEYIGLLSPTGGIRMSINSRDIMTFPEDEGFSISPGTSTSIRIHEKQYQRMSLPHGDCTDDKWPHTVKSAGATEFKYSSKACNKYCLAEYTLRQCSCVSSIIISHEKNAMDMPLCSLINEAHRRCQEKVLHDYSVGKLECECKVPCKEQVYKTTLSTTRWPEKSYLMHLLRMLQLEEGERIKGFTSANRKKLVSSNFREAVTREVLDDVRSNFVKLEVYFDDLSAEYIYEEEELSVETYLSNIGGSLGLWVGLSIISLMEAFEVIFYFVRWWYRAKSKRKKYAEVTRRESEDKSCSQSGQTPLTSTDKLPTFPHERQLTNIQKSGGFIHPRPSIGANSSATSPSSSVLGGLSTLANYPPPTGANYQSGNDGLRATIPPSQHFIDHRAAPPYWPDKLGSIDENNRWLQAAAVGSASKDEGDGRKNHYHDAGGARRRKNQEADPPCYPSNSAQDSQMGQNFDPRFNEPPPPMYNAVRSVNKAGPTNSQSTCTDV